LTWAIILKCVIIIMLLTVCNLKVESIGIADHRLGSYEYMSFWSRAWNNPQISTTDAKIDPIKTSAFYMIYTYEQDIHLKV
jgi:hypothetical protein